MRALALRTGTLIPVLGQGTWRMGEAPAARRAEAEALRAGIDLGMTLIDTAEMYGEGETETFLGEALAGLRRRVFLVSKVYPHNAGRARLPRACEASLRRLRTDHLDLYLLHWRGDVPLGETVEALEALVRAGKIRAWGVSNFDTEDLDDLAEAGGAACAVNQILYNVTRRGPEFDLLPAMDARGIAAMAYSPVEQGRLPGDGALAAVAARHGATPYQVALAFTLRRPGVMAIPKAGRLAHVQENARAADLALGAEDLAALDAAFPPPRRKTPLAML
ncbi:aldo/keto reductase [Methylobacterium sp. 4-46]|uniref:aldo/keto reductase n=1 Tax=unclassified Methylobacterium TaxID=2615210 RepID=UPI000165C9DF|nr:MULTISPECIES: aldo/keto reductase [Methylobacterium]ACA17887.1 aldo/keto reductase [Methylobacterium sp. 4-46]WFT77188.1 aldo/keto reductase [Methylobacterium nodulans]